MPRAKKPPTELSSELTAGPVNTISCNDQYLTIVQHPQIVTNEADLPAASHIGPSEPESIGLNCPVFPGEIQIELLQESQHAECWDSALPEKRGDDLFFWKEFDDDAATDFDPFEGMELSEPSRAFSEFL